MNRRFNVFIGLTLAALSVTVFAVLAAEPDGSALFKRGNEAYKNQDYQGALELYEKASETLKVSECYFNAGNAAFKANRLGLAILYYERAKRLDPRNSDTLSNLKYARGLVEYKVEDKRNWYYVKIVQFLESVRFCECLAASSFIFLLFILSRIGMLIVRGGSRFGALNKCLTIALIAAAVVTYLKFHQSAIERRGVVVAPKIDVRYGPSRDNQLAFSLVEGIQLFIEDEMEGWVRVSLENGTSGWTPQEGIELI